ncbi:hypothetical protein EYF80_051615 [Liparis tanakae]|uniref:Uncharacterized protein n=1 Tax=Liparis tanakae TaxID=230148 RepID=A0A4Z2FAE3_9TELE|nr:hypothetical protein EYF80_051615 [Liparis tanakae]
MALLSSVSQASASAATFDNLPPYALQGSVLTDWGSLCCTAGVLQLELLNAVKLQRNMDAVLHGARYLKRCRMDELMCSGILNTL